MRQAVNSSGEKKGGMGAAPQRHRPLLTLPTSTRSSWTAAYHRTRSYNTRRHASLRPSSPNVANDVGQLYAELTKRSAQLPSCELTWCAMRKYGRWMRKEPELDDRFAKLVTDVCHSVVTIAANIPFIAPYAGHDAAEDLQDALVTASQAVSAECSRVSSEPRWPDWPLRDHTNEVNDVAITTPSLSQSLEQVALARLPGRWRFPSSKVEVCQSSQW